MEKKKKTKRAGVNAGERNRVTTKSSDSGILTSGKTTVYAPSEMEMPDRTTNPKDSAVHVTKVLSIFNWASADMPANTLWPKGFSSTTSFLPFLSDFFFLAVFTLWDSPSLIPYFLKIVSASVSHQTPVMLSI